MKSCVAILGAFTEFSELYVRHLCSLHHHVALIDLDAKKAEDLQKLAKRNPEHFTNLNVSYHVLSEGNLFDSLVAVLASLEASYKVCGLLNIKEKLVVEGAKAAEAFGLPGVGVLAATVSRNKFLQRKVFAGTPFVPASRILPLGEALAQAPARGALKPVSEHGSVGVVLWKNSSQLPQVKASLEKFNEKDLFMLEDLVEGPEYSLEAWVAQGQVLTSHVTAKDTLPAEGIEFPVEVGHRVFFEDHLSQDVKDQLQKVLSRILRETSLKNAVLHLEFKIANHQVAIMEWCVRNPGDRIMDLYYYSGAFNPYALYADICLGKKPQNFSEPKRIARQLYFSAVDSLNKISTQNALCYWPKHSNYSGFTRKERGVLLPHNGCQLHEVGILLGPDEIAHAPAIRDSFSRHAYVIVSYPYFAEDHMQSQSVESLVAACIEKGAAC